MSLALFAFAGALPSALIEALDERPLICAMETAPPELPGVDVSQTDMLSYRPETLGTLIQELKARGVDQLCFAGALRRPVLDPARIDAATLPLVPRLMQAMGQGDDGTLRAILALFEEQGFLIRAAHEIAPELLPPEGLIGSKLSQNAEADVLRAAEVLRQLSALDLGQSCVVRQGQVIALEAAPGTDWMLSRLTDLPQGVSCSGGVFYKAPKQGQDRRIDLPVIGPRTIELAHQAGLDVVAIEAGGVMMLSPERCAQIAQDRAIALWVRR